MILKITDPYNNERKTEMVKISNEQVMFKYLDDYMENNRYAGWSHFQKRITNPKDLKKFQEKYPEYLI